MILTAARVVAPSVLMAGMAFGQAQVATNSIPKRELTPADAVATVRLIPNQAALSAQGDVASISPDGKRYVIRTSYGDAGRDGVWGDVLTGALDSLAGARPKLCAHLFTTGLGSPRGSQGADNDPKPVNTLRWLSNDQVGFLWSDNNGVRQAMSVDVAHCKIKSLTHSATSVAAFVTGTDGTLLFDAKVQHSASASSRLWTDGFTVSDASDGWSILRGDVDGVDVQGVDFDNAWFIRLPSGSTKRVEIAGDPIDATNPSYRELSLAPSGHFAVTHVGLRHVPQDWSNYLSPTLKRVIEENGTSPGGIPLQYAVIDVHRGTSRTLWSAPRGLRSQLSWSPQDDVVLLAPTFLPLTATDPPGLAGFAAAIVDVSTGEYEPVPADLTGRELVRMQWLSATAIQMLTTDSSNQDARTEQFRKSGNRWERIPAGEAPIEARRDQPHSTIHIETRQTLNNPPQVYAVDSAHGTEERIFDSNPLLLSSFKLGRVERISGKLSTGQQWLGQLIYPADYVPGKKYPLLIQSLYGRAWGDEDFTLNGSWGENGAGLGPSQVPSYPGQLLATRDIAVLELEVLKPSQDSKEAENYQLAFETVAEQLSASGLVDRSKVALAGFSRNGYWVEFTLAHSKFPFAAAVAADNYDPSYFQSAIANWRVDDAQANGGEAFGEGFQQWLAHAPGFNAEHMHAPLWIIGQSDGISLVMAEWEIFSRLRHLHRPVEMYMMPDADKHPSHLPQSPRQIMSIQAGVIDWLSFWLTGREDPSPKKQAQYARWREFRTLQAASVSQEAH
jgi:Prolyl oligopeptidase family